ncbi:30S ribosomal protein S16 [Patescibacteria group bacterium]|nr:30S ribosomal protein S16 [Patescibacteria group bacterium]
MLKIRLMRIGAKKKPFYRVVAVDEHAKRTGAYLELLGTYNPLTEPKEIKLKQDRIDHWIKQGAQMSTGFLRIIGKAPQRPPRKPKKSHAAEAPRDKEKKSEEPSVVSPQSSEKKEEKIETKTEKTGVSEPAAEEKSIEENPEVQPEKIIEEEQAVETVAEKKEVPNEGSA